MLANLARMLRRPAATRQRGAATADTQSLPAPTGGWNARDSVANMEPADAVLMDNMFPETADVRLRRGFSNHATGLGAQVETLAPYSTPAGTQTLFAAAGTDIYDATSAGAIGAAVQSGLTNARWQFANITTSGGSYIYLVNGADKPRLWDGSAWVAVDGTTTPAITGVTTTTLIHVNLFKERLWFVQKDTLKAWYLPTSAIGGAATAFDLSSIAKKGGYLMAMATWTLDAGEGADDYAVFVTSEGEAIVYGGTDPASAATWALRGRWELGSPIGRRCFAKFGGDVLLILRDGVLPLSRALLSERVSLTEAVTDKIRGAMTPAAATYGANFGWQLLHYPKAAMLILNVPLGTGIQQQYAQNTTTGSWGRFKDVDANCWALFGDEPYFGGNAVVGKFWSQDSDAGSNIMADCQQAFNYFGARGQKKLFTLIRPIIAASAAPGIEMGISTDFSTDDPTTTPSYVGVSFAQWGTALWGSALWIADLASFKTWQSAPALGYCGSVRIKIAAQGIQVRWQASDVVFQRGGTL